MNNQTQDSGQLDQSEYQAVQRQDYERQFENTNTIYELNSKVNEAEIRLQKMSLQFQSQMNEERLYYQQIQIQRRNLQDRVQQMEQECNKLKIMLEAERTSKGKMGRQLQFVRGCMYEIFKLFDGDQNTQFNELKNRISLLKMKKNEVQGTVQNLKIEISKIKLEDQKKFRRAETQWKQKIRSLQQMLAQKRENCFKTEECLRASMARNVRLQQLQKELRGESKRTQELLKNLLMKEQEISTLRLQQESWLLGRDQWKDQRIRLQDEMENVRFQLEFSIKKLGVCEDRLKEEQKDLQRLQDHIVGIKEKYRNLQQRYMQLEENHEDLKSKVHVCDIYKQKYKKVQNRLKEVERKAEDFCKLADGYAHQIQELQSHISILEKQKQEYIKSAEDLSQLIEQKTKQMMKMGVVMNHQDEIVKQLRTDVQNYKNQLEQLRFLTRREREEFKQMQEWEKTKRQIIDHYEQILLTEDSNRCQLQRQLSQSKSQIIGFKEQIHRQKREVHELRQQIKHFTEANEDLRRSLTQLNKSHEKRLANFKDRYNEMQKINRETVRPSNRAKLQLVHTFSLYQEGILLLNPDDKVVKYAGGKQSKRSKPDLKNGVNFSELRQKSDLPSVQKEIKAMKVANQSIKNLIASL